MFFVLSCTLEHIHSYKKNSLSSALQTVTLLKERCTSFYYCWYCPLHPVSNSKYTFVFIKCFLIKCCSLIPLYTGLIIPFLKYDSRQSFWCLGQSYFILRTSFYMCVTVGVNCIELNQPSVMVVKPGESFSIACKITGYSASGGGCTNWIRHSTGKALEWIGWFCSFNDKGTSDKMKNKISFTADTSSNTVSLQSQHFQTEDTAVYYCARNTQCNELPLDLCKNILYLYVLCCMCTGCTEGKSMFYTHCQLEMLY